MLTVWNTYIESVSEVMKVLRWTTHKTYNKGDEELKILKLTAIVSNNQYHDDSP